MAVALNLNGQRFADESEGTGEELLNSRIALQPGCRAVYVFDALIGERALEGGPLARVVADRARQAGARVLQADSLEELARQMGEWGLPPAVALRTMQAYNEAMGSQDQQALLPPRRNHRYPLATAPYTAVLVQASITFTCGGLVTDMDVRVLRRSSSISSRACTRQVAMSGASTGAGMSADSRRPSSPGALPAWKRAGLAGDARRVGTVHT